MQCSYQGLSEEELPVDEACCKPDRLKIRGSVLEFVGVKPFLFFLLGFLKSTSQGSEIKFGE